jgi:hypothetical protein
MLLLLLLLLCLEPLLLLLSSDGLLKNGNCGRLCHIVGLGMCKEFR